MRRFADLTMRPAWRNICGSLERIVPPPAASELWYDSRDIAALKDDITDFAEVQAKQAQAMRTLIDAGFEPDAVVDMITAGDTKRLRGHHTGLFSVQLQPPQPEGPPEPVVTVTAPEPKQLPEPKRDRDLDESFAIIRALADREQAAPVVNTYVTTPEVNVPPTTVTIERGAVEVSAPVTVEPAAITVVTPEVRNEISVEPTPVTVTNEVSVEPTPVEIRNDVTVEPAPVEVTVEPTPVSITNEVPGQRPVTRRVVRNAENQITEIIEEPTDG
jgi:hypothetical protein